MTFLRSIRSFLATLNAAVEVSAAVEAHRAPRPAALDRLGIDRAAFSGIRL